MGWLLANEMAHKSFFLFGMVLFLQHTVPPTQAARILGLFPHPIKSHFDVFQPLMEGLAAKGHNVTVVGFFPHKNPPPGYHDISLKGLAEVFTNAFPISEFENPPPEWLRPYGQYLLHVRIGLDACRAVLPSPQIQSLIQAKGEFDIAVIEEFDADCFLAIPYKLEVPYIGFSSCTLLPWLQSRMANPQHASHVSNMFTGVGTRMNFMERVRNSFNSFMTAAFYYHMFQVPSQELAEKYIGPVPPLEELARNTSLMLVNTHFTVQQARPLQPSVVEVGGIHVRPAKPLPKDLEEFVSGATDGVIVFSMGSILNASSFDPVKQETFLNVFRSLPQRVVWKIDGVVHGLPSNVKTIAWLPQRDILAHPNVKAFIAHGGLLGMTEAVVSGKPFVAFPMFGDQHNNVQSAVQAGIAVRLDIDSVSEDTLREALKTVLSDRYQQRASAVAAEYNDRPVPPLDLAIYWVEYVLRHGGRSLRSAAVDLTTIQYYQLDIAAMFVFILVAMFFSVKLGLRLIFSMGKTVEKVKKQ